MPTNTNHIGTVPTRDLYFDTTKGVLIFLVVFGHLIERFLNNDTNLAVYQFIYLFHMPLFVIISGYFTSRDISKIKKSVVNIAEVYIVLQFARRATFLSPSIDLFLIPQWTLWYLLSLCFWKIGYIPFAHKNRTTKFYLLGCLIILSLLVGFIPLDYELSLQRTFRYAPFFVFGILLRDTQTITIIKNANKYVSITVLAATCIYFYAYSPDIRQLLFRTNLYDCTQPIIPQISANLIVFLVATLNCLAILNLIKTVKIFAVCGKHSLIIYALHSKALFYLFKLQQANFLHIPNHLSIIVVLAIIITLFLSYLGNFSFFRNILHPFSYVYAQIRHKKQ